MKESISLSEFIRELGKSLGNEEGKDEEWQEIMTEAGVEDCEELFYMIDDFGILGEPEAWMIRAIEKRAKEIETYMNNYFNLAGSENPWDHFKNMKIECVPRYEVEFEVSRGEVVGTYNYDFWLYTLIIEEAKEIGTDMLPMLLNERCIDERHLPITVSNKTALEFYTKSLLDKLKETTQSC